MLSLLFTRGGSSCRVGVYATAELLSIICHNTAERQGGGSGAGYDCDTTTGSGYTQIVNSYANINNYGCVADCKTL